MTIRTENRNVKSLLDAHGQKICDKDNGDCFRASMSYVLRVRNGDHLPNPVGEEWFGVWWKFLGDFGIEICYGSRNKAIWRTPPWIASVPSKNFRGKTHAIVLHQGGRVAFDPSPKRRYRPNVSLLGKDVVQGGYSFMLADTSKLEHFVKWRKKYMAV